MCMNLQDQRHLAANSEQGNKNGTKQELLRISEAFHLMNKSMAHAHT